MNTNSESLLTATQLADLTRPGPVPLRRFGNTDDYVSAIGLGGSALRNLSSRAVEELVEYAIDQGVTYLDLAPSYPTVEEKVAPVVRRRREKLWLVSKTHDRTADGARRLLEGTLVTLGTNHVDEWRMHGVAAFEDLEALLAPGGALEYAEKAKAQGKVRYISLSGHYPEVLLKALGNYPFDSVLVVLNYLDRFNFPLTWERLLPLCYDRGIAVIAMKVFGDGLLKYSARTALRYALSLPVACATCGVESRAELEADLEVARNFKPVTPSEFRSLTKTLPELGRAICRLCGRCLPCPEGIDLVRVFELEGYFDRQLDNAACTYEGLDPAEIEAHKHWFNLQQVAQAKAKQLAVSSERCSECNLCNERCYYHLPVKEKLREAWRKLGG